jgi:hypothetical protein
MELAMPIVTRSLIVMIFTGLALTSVQASGMWLIPAPAAPQTAQGVTLRLMLGRSLQGEEQPYDPERIASFQRIRKNGRSSLAGQPGKSPAASFRSGGAGVELIALAARSAPGRSPDRFCKTLLVVGDADVDDPIRWSELGQRLEIVPQSDPVKLLRSGGELEVQVLFEREPLAGVQVRAVPQVAREGGSRTATTDEIGLATFKLDTPGLWLIEVARGNVHSTLVLSVGSH